jgi:hypothetical protein
VIAQIEPMIGQTRSLPRAFQISNMQLMHNFGSIFSRDMQGYADATANQLSSL